MRESITQGRDPEAASMLEGLSRRLKTARKMQSAKIGDIARAADCSGSMISRVESGKSFVSLPMLTRLAATLGVEVSWLLEGDPDDVPRIAYSRSKLRALPRCTDKARSELQRSFGQTSSLVESIHITSDEMLSRINRLDRPAACLVLNGILDISSKTSYVHVRTGGFFEISGMEEFTYQSASDADVSLIVISL